MARRSRTDAHRPGVIVPAHYTEWQYYSLSSSSGGVGTPPINLDCAWPVPVFDRRGRVTGTRVPPCADTGRCCVASIERRWLEHGVAIFGSPGKCGVCGAHFVYGTVFRHDPSGELVHMGHDCAQKYAMLHDRSSLELELGRVRSATAARLSRAKNEAELEKFYANCPGLEADLELGRADGSKEERIIAEIGDKLSRFRSISDKQVQFVQRLAADLRRPVSARVEERHVEAPVGRCVEFVGEIVAVRVQDGFRGAEIKMTVKVTTVGGSWLAYGTMPRSLYVDAGLDPRSLSQRYRGRCVRIRSTLILPPPREPGSLGDVVDSGAVVHDAKRHFVWMSRPRAEYVDDPRGPGDALGPTRSVGPVGAPVAVDLVDEDVRR